MIRNHKLLFLAAVLVWACLTALVIAQLTYVPQPYQKRYDGVSTSFVARGAVDSKLAQYVNLAAATFSGSSGPGYSWNTADGQVSWIGNPNMTLHSMENLHLTVYATVDNNETHGNLTIIQVGLHVVVNQTATPIPQGTLSHQEVIIPNLGLENPRFEYHFNCSTYIPPSQTPSPMGNA